MKIDNKKIDFERFPNDWSIVSTQDILLNTNNAMKIGPFGSQLKKEYLVDSGKKVYGQENVYNNDFTLGNRYISESRFNKLKSCQIKSGNVVISMMGTIGKCAIVPNGIEEGIMDSHLIKLEIDNGKFCKEFLKQLMDSEIIKRQIKKLSVGGIMEGLSSAIIKQLHYPSPPLPEQQKIADILSTVDQQIEQTDSLIGKTKELKKGLMQKLLTKGIGHTKFKKTEVGEIPVEWEVKSIEQICNILDSKRIPLSAKQREKMKGDIPYYGTNGVIDYVNDYLFNEPLILMAEDGGFFEDFRNRPIAFLIRGKAWVNNHAHVLQPKEGECIEWIYYNLVHKDITDMVQGGTRSKLNQKDLRRITIAYPKDIEEQRKIADILSNVDQKIEQYESKKHYLQSLKKGLMQKLLTGKIRVNVSEEDSLCQQDLATKSL